MKITLRLLVLSGMAAVAFYMAQPTPVEASVCTTQCLNNYHTCVMFGAVGCNDALIACYAECNGFQLGHQACRDESFGIF